MEKAMKKQIGLTLMELVIAIVVAIAMGAGGIVLYQDLTVNAKTAARNDLAAKVATAITLYISNSAGGIPSGTELVTSYLSNVICSGTTGDMFSSGTTIYAVLLNSTGADLDSCATHGAYGVKPGT